MGRSVTCSDYVYMYFTHICSSVSEAVIFLFLGISLYDVAVQNWDTGLVLWTLVFALIFRPIGKTDSLHVVTA